MSYRKRRADEAELDNLPYRPSLAVSKRYKRGDINTRDDYYDYHRYMEEDMCEIIRESRWYRGNNRYQDRDLNLYSRPVKAHDVGRIASYSRSSAKAGRTGDRSYKWSRYDRYERYQHNDRYQTGGRYDHTDRYDARLPSRSGYDIQDDHQGDRYERDDRYDPRLPSGSGCDIQDDHLEQSMREYRYQYSSSTPEREARKSSHSVDHHVSHRNRYNTSRDPDNIVSQSDNRTDTDVSRPSSNDIVTKRSVNYSKRKTWGESKRSRVGVDECPGDYNSEDTVENTELIETEFDDAASSSNEIDQKITHDSDDECEKLGFDAESDETDQNDEATDAEQVTEDSVNSLSETDQKTTDDCEDDCVLEIFIDGFWDAFDNDEEDFKLLVEQREKDKAKSHKKIK